MSKQLENRDYRIYSWNVNGIRAMYKKGFEDWLIRVKPDILCLQETKAQYQDLAKKYHQLADYNLYYYDAQKKGYSGVAVYVKQKIPVSKISTGFQNSCTELADVKDNEGRIIKLELNDFSLFNIYFPNGKRSKKRLHFKLNFYENFYSWMKQLIGQNKRIVVCGDVNTAHQAIDLARPKDNQNVSGFLPQERDWISKLLNLGFVDVYRQLHPNRVKYSWWSYRSKARQRNVGWRIDYFFISQNLSVNVVKADIHNEIIGSDHCPISLELQF